MSDVFRSLPPDGGLPTPKKKWSETFSVHKVLFDFFFGVSEEDYIKKRKAELIILEKMREEGDNPINLRISFEEDFLIRATVDELVEAGLEAWEAIKAGNYEDMPPLDDSRRIPHTGRQKKTVAELITEIPFGE